MYTVDELRAIIKEELDKKEYIQEPYSLFEPILDILEKEIEPLKEQGVVWGYNIPYLLTGQLNQHPRTAIAATKEKRKDYRNFYVELVDYK